MIKGLAHVCFTVASLPASERFYCDVLGFKRAFEFVNAQGHRYGRYIGAGPRTFIEVFEGKLEGGAAPSFRHICLEVDDMAVTVRELRAKGVEVSEPTLGMDQSYQAWLSDPDGNRIELHQYTPASWQAPYLG